jgi:DUF177 domain-containing protein
MALIVNVRQLELKDLHLEGEMPVAELDLEGVDDLIELAEPLHYGLTAERLGENVLVQGQLQCTLKCHCVRCLKGFTQEIDLENWTCDLPLEGEEKAIVTNDCIDLTPYIREDILLAFPQHPLCEQDCRGMLPPDNNLSKPASVKEQSRGSAAAWAALNKLKF